MATMVTSSIMVFSDLSSNFKEVSTIKQMPSKLEDAFKICGDFSAGWFMVCVLKYNNHQDYAQSSKQKHKYCDGVVI